MHNNYDDLDDKKNVSDNYMIRYDFPDASKIPPLKRGDNPTYLHELMIAAAQQRIHAHENRIATRRSIL